jgi:hypothetical protein
VRLQIIADHSIPSYAPIEFSAGDEVSFVRADTQWPAFAWCESSRGGAWIPIAYLGGEGAGRKLVRDYSSRELPVRTGDVVDAIDECGGWYFVRDARGEIGWIPLECARGI